MRMLATALVTPNEVQLNSDTEWMDPLGIVVTNPAFFGVTDSFGLVTGQCRVYGEGAVLVMREAVDSEDERDLVTAPVALPDTNYQWRAFQFVTDVPPDPRDLNRAFLLYGRRGSFEVFAQLRGVSMSLMSPV